MCLLVAAGCVPLNQPDPYAQVELTPYHTRTPQSTLAAASAATQNPTAVPAATLIATPEATPAPILHEVALQETVSSIAQRYGVPSEAILAANPDVDPRVLVVGMQLLIPMNQAVSPPSASASETLALDLRDARCEATPEGGLWCHALLSNPFTFAAERLLVSFVIKTDEAADALRVNVPALLNRIPPGESLPVSAYVPAPAPRPISVSAELLSAQPVQENDGTYLDAVLQNERINLQGRLARVTVEVLLPEDALQQAAAAPEIWLLASAYDDQGRLLGARRLEYVPEDARQNPVELSTQVFSSGAQIDSLRLQVEAYLPQ